MKTLKLWAQRYLVVRMGRSGSLSQVAPKRLLTPVASAAQPGSCGKRNSFLPLRYTVLLGHLTSSRVLMTKVSPICLPQVRFFPLTMEVSQNGIRLGVAQE